jgi:hypothetical protein
MSQDLNTSQSYQKHKTSHLLLLGMIGVATVVFLAVWAILTSLLGKDVATLLTLVPVSVFSSYIISRWESIKIQPDLNWRNYIQRLELKFWKIGLVLLTIFIIQRFVDYFLFLFHETMRPDFINSLPEEPIEFYGAYLSDPLTFSVMIITLISSYFLGGYVAGKISRHGYLAPYTHAAVGASLIYIINIALTWDYMCSCFTQENGGIIILVMLAGILFSALGVKAAIRKPIFPGREKPAESLSVEPNAVVASMPIAGSTQAVQQAAKLHGSGSDNLQRRFPKRVKRKRRR